MMAESKTGLKRHDGVPLDTAFLTEHSPSTLLFRSLFILFPLQGSIDLSCSGEQFVLDGFH
ncbi:MAG: hypothetical protein EBU26_13780 [Verrucomicrobia bacterium]|nr:hypothetical protein [Verrucomicrobiota bacterium]